MTEGSASDEDIFNVDRIRRLIDLMKEYDLSEIDLKQKDEQIRLVRGASQVAVAMPMAQPVPVIGPPSSSGSSAGSSAANDDGPHIAIIKSPMVGTFYSRANPKSEAFVKVGASIAPDTIVCIVEAMKVFNEIPAEVRGKIVAILAENEEPVEFGRPLFKVDTRG